MEQASRQAGSLWARFQAQMAETESSDRSFGLLAGAVFVLIALLPWWKGGAPRWWALSLAAALVLVALAAPGLLREPKRGWLFLGFLLGMVVNPIVLGILFFLVITPVGLLTRLLGRDPLWLRPKPGLASYWQARSEPPSDMKEQF